MMVHIASVWVPFTSESKEAIAHYPEILKEIRLALQECGRQRRDAHPQAPPRGRRGARSATTSRSTSRTSRSPCRRSSSFDDAERDEVVDATSRDVLERQPEDGLMAATEKPGRRRTAKKATERRGEGGRAKRAEGDARAEPELDDGHGRRRSHGGQRVHEKIRRRRQARARLPDPLARQRRVRAEEGLLRDRRARRRRAR